ncbi:hypothetical protein RRG08_019008 [Elysia crispata]|uniref:Uncharacterized protein n=1 Tax=Elysia crispata TaxID=231223 RepID=A0AAE1DSS0_9GAST|nr:hypothetical protein RRG08_019008 [Elysia crispata]
MRSSFYRTAMLAPAARGEHQSFARVLTPNYCRQSSLAIPPEQLPIDLTLISFINGCVYRSDLVSASLKHPGLAAVIKSPSSTCRVMHAPDARPLLLISLAVESAASEMELCEVQTRAFNILQDPSLLILFFLSFPTLSLICQLLKALS